MTFCSKFYLLMNERNLKNGSYVIKRIGKKKFCCKRRENVSSETIGTHKVSSDVFK